MAEYINTFNLFPVPVFRYAFPDFETKGAPIINHLMSETPWLEDEERNGLQATDANLHKVAALAPLKDFFQECFEDAMDRMGYLKDCGIVSMWGTRHRQGGHHHGHLHRNCFLAGVIYLYDHDKTAGGTVFHNPNHLLFQIDPPENKDKQRILNVSEQMPFIPGTCLIFPGWAAHSTVPCNSNYRLIVAANMMPIGKTNTDHYDRYNFPDPATLDLKQYGDK